MAPKRKLEMNAVIEESQRALFCSFQNTANNLSLFYNQCVDNQQLAYKAGQKYAILKFNEWMLEKMQEGKIITVSEIIAYLQSNLNGSMHGEGGSESQQNNAPQGTHSVQAASSSAPTNPSQNSDQEMQMD